MASEFLKKLAREQENRIDKQFGATAYGGSRSGQSRETSVPSSSAVGTGIAVQKTGTGASSFLRGLAREQERRIDSQYGSTAYGGSQSRIGAESGKVEQSDPSRWESGLGRRIGLDSLRRDVGQYQDWDTQGLQEDVRSARERYQQALSKAPNSSMDFTRWTPEDYQASVEALRTAMDELHGAERELERVQYLKDNAGKVYQSQLFQQLRSEGDFQRTADTMRQSTPAAAIPFWQGNLGAREVVRSIQMGDMSRVAGQWGNMTVEQQDTLLYLAGKGDWDRATEYLELIEPELNAQALENQRETAAAFAEEHPVLASAASVPASLLGGAFSLADLAAQNVNRLITGEAVDYNSEGQRLGQLAEQIREPVQEKIEENTDFTVGDTNVAGFLYNTLMSGADSLAAGLSAPANVAGLILAGNAASSSARDISRRGGTDNQALVGGIAAGIFEALFERVSIGNFQALKEVPVSGVKDVVTNVLKSMGVNASEEAATELSNIVFDTLAMGDISNWQRSIEAYMSQDMSKEKAIKNTISDLFWQVFEAGAGGAVMGAGFGGLGSAMSALDRRISRTGGEGFRQAGAGDTAEETGQETVDPMRSDLGRMDSSGRTERQDYSRQAEEALADSAAERVPPDRAGLEQNAPAAAQGQDMGSRAGERTALLREETGDVDTQAQIEELANTLGEHGQKAFRSMGVEGGDVAEAFRAFARAYNQGMSGQTLTRADSGGVLTPGQRVAAYSAGQNDGAASLARERRAAQYAKVAGKESGLVYDEFVRQAIESGRTAEDGAGGTVLSKETAERINAVAKALGVRVRFTDQVRGGTANAAIRGSEILVERNNPNPVLFVLGHEWTHRLQELAPEEYRAFRNGLAGELEGEAEILLDQYRREDEDISYEEALDEAAANYAGRLLEDGELLDEFIQKNRDNRTLLEKMRDAIRRLIRKLRGSRYQAMTAGERRAAIAAEKKLTAALEAAARQVKSLQSKSGDDTMSPTKYSVKYWRPDLNAAEWKLLNRRMQREIGDPAHSLDEATQWAYAEEKGVRVFAIYGVGDGTEATPLFAVGGENAHVAYELLMSKMEDIENGINGNRADISQWINIIRSNQKHGRRNSDASGRAGTASKEIDKLHDGASGSNAEGIAGTGDQNEKVKPRLSLKTPVEETQDLVALHNLTEDKLRSALQLGGFPMPSIAVTRADIPHTNFGDITLVMSRQTVDPQANRRNTVYSADAWTPTFPAIEYEADPQVERRVSRRIGELSGRVDPFFQEDLRRIQYGLEDYLNRHGGEEGLVRWVMDNYGLKAAYLEEQGQHIAAATTQREAERGYSPERADRYQAITEALGTRDPAAIGALNLKETRERYGEALEAAFPGMTKSALRMSSILGQVQAYLEDQGRGPVYETVTDGAATRRAVDQALDRAGYEQWVRELYAGIEGASGVYNNKERFTPSGNRRSFRQLHYPVTLDNITKAMAGQNNGNSRNVSGFYGIKSLRAGMAERFKSIADMHRLEGRLQNLTEEEITGITDALNNRLYEIVGEVAERSPGGSRSLDYMQTDAIGTILMEIAESGTYTIDSIMRTLNEEYRYRISNELAAKIRDLLFDVSQMPVNIFEAKPERSVHFDEVLAAVVPDDAGSGLPEALTQAGVGQVLTYEAGNEADRMAKVNSVEGARFSLKMDSQGRELTKGQQEFFKDSKVRVDEYGDYGYEDGNLVPVYHATWNDEFTVFDRSRLGENTDDSAWDEGFASTAYIGFWFNTQNLSEQSGGRARAGSRAEEVYLNITKLYDAGSLDDLAGEIMEHSDGATPAERGEEFRNWLQTQGYDGIMLKDSEFGGISFVALYPEQIKRVDNQNPTSDPDIRHSLKGSERAAELAKLERENQLLRERVEYWKGQTRRTRRVTTDRKAVARAARELIRTYGAQAEAEELTPELQSLYDYIASGRDGNDELTYSEARRRAEEIARSLVESAVAVDEELYQQYRDLREYLRETELTVSQANSSGLADYRLKLRRGRETNIDRVYRELSERWPELFDEERETNPADQLLHIGEVLEQIYQITEYNPFSQYMEQAVQDAANEVLERFFELPQTQKTFADRQAARLEAERAGGRQALAAERERGRAAAKDALLAGQMAQGRRDAAALRRSEERMARLRVENRERVQRVIARERENRQRQLERMKNRYAARDAAYRERRSARELRRRIARHANALSQKLLRPTDQQHIPDDLRTTVAAVLEAINLESGPSAKTFTLDPVTKERVYRPAGTPTNRTRAFQALKEQYAKIAAEGGELVIDPSLFGSEADGIKGKFDQVIGLADTRLADMNTQQLQTVWEVLRAVEHSIRNAGKTLAEAKYGQTREWAEALAADTASRRGKKSLTSGHALLDLENPYTFFSHYGEAGMSVYRMLRDAQDRQQLMADQVAQEARKIVDSKTVEALEKSARTFTTQRGETLTLSTAQVMELYELSKREQARDHLHKGGIVQPEVKSKRIRRGTESIRLSEQDLEQITGTLTAEQKQIADGLQKLTEGLLAEFGNRASLEVYGYRKFTEKHYWPIKTAKEGIHSNVERGWDNPRSIKNIGMAKSTMPHASNPLDLAGIFSTFASHAGDMTDYAAWLAPMEDANRLFNYQFRDGDGNPTGKTVKGLLDRVGGTGSQKYWRNLMEDIQNGIGTRGDSPMWEIVGKGIGSFRGAAVGGNLRVVIQQPTAFLRAAAVLSPEDLSRGVLGGATRGSGWSKALRYSPIAMRKAAGGFDISSPLRMKEQLFDGRTKVRKLNDALSAPAGMADALTWGKLWNACEWAVAREHKELQKGSESFYRKVSELFAEVIDQTQVVDGVLQRSNIMRSSNAVVQQATSFMGEPIMSLNLFLRAYDQVRYEQDRGKRGRALKTLGRAATALVATNVVNALAQSLVDAMRDDDRDKDYWEKFFSAFTGLSGEEESPWDKAVSMVFNGNLGGGLNPVGQIPFARDVLSLLQGYDVSRSEMEVVADLVRAGQTALRSAGGTGSKTRAYAVKELLAAGAKLFGTPVGNVARDVWALARSIAAGTGNIPLQYEMEKAIYNITSSENKGRYYDILFQALSQGDLDSYRSIREEVMDRMGVDGPAIDSAMRSRLKKAREQDGSFQLSQPALDLIGEVEGYEEPEKPGGFTAADLDAAAYQRYAEQRAGDYREMADTLEDYPAFREFDNETKNTILESAYRLAGEKALAAQSGGSYEMDTKWMLWAAGGADYGVDETEAILFKTAYDMIEGDKDENGNTISGSKKENVLEAVETMMPWLNDGELEYLMANYWTPEDKDLKERKENDFRE